MKPPIHFISAPDGVSLAVASFGSGPPLIIVPGWISHLELDLASSPNHEMYTRLSRTNTVILYDKRGTGLSDRDVTDYSPEANLADLDAIINGLGLKGVTVLGYSQGGPIAIAYTTQHADNVHSLVLYGSYHDGTTAYFKDLVEGFVSLMRHDWGGIGSSALLELFAPGASPESRIFFTEYMRQAADGPAAIATMKSLFDFRVTDLLPQVSVPTLVLHRRGDKVCPFTQGREMAAKIKGARFVALEGDIHVIGLGDVEPLISAIEEFLGGSEGISSEPVRDGLQTILFTDMVDSTATTSRMGDAGAQDLVRAHNQVVRDALRSFGGVEVKHTGDGIMATFPSASRALNCALVIQTSIALHNGANGTDLQVRVGLNAGEPIAEEKDFFGTSVQMAARICAEAGRGQVLASNVVRELAAGKGFDFADAGEASLKGFEAPARLYVVTRSR
jgi:class 3 adenylate cyclase/pimeloyl-ACP methyl ester carboxylesterase